MQFSVLYGARDDERRRWIDLWNRWSGREVFAHPAYGDLFLAQGDRLLCASWVADGGGILFPFIARPLAREPWAAGCEQFWDGVNPYGYGGPYVWGKGGEAAEDFWERFAAWARESELVSLFARLSLFAEQILPFDGEVLDNAPNVVRSLDLSQQDLWYDYEHKVRKNVKRAKASDLTVEEDPDGRELESFLEIYNSTMDRRGAASGYYFSRDFFSRLLKNLPGQFNLFHVRDKGRIVSTELVLVSQSNIYSFLGGTRAEAFEKRPNDLLKHEVILWGMEKGKKSFVLGGGYGGPDGIFKYKRSFAPKGEVMFRVAHRIDLPGQYDALVDSRRAFESSQGRDWTPRPGFFPAYRAPR